jgi:hypothetical protein
MTYAFDFLNATGAIDHIDLGYFAADGEACAQAKAALLVSYTAVAVDVWRDDRFLATVEHPFRRLAPGVVQAPPAND